MKQFCMALLIVGLIFLSWILLSLVENGDYKAIHSWAQNNGHIVKNIERRLVDIGPFWYTDKHMRVYKVNIENSKIVWFRIGSRFDVVEE